jgi:hypothetical protein
VLKKNFKEVMPSVVDLREAIEDEELFADAVHLNVSGRRAVSLRLGRELRASPSEASP